METVFFVASKVVWALIRPETLLLLGLLAVLLLHRRRPVVARTTLASVLAVFALIAVLPFGDLLLAPLERRHPPDPPVREVSNIIVLGGGESADLTALTGQPQLNQAGERFLAGITLARRFPDARLIFTGGSGALIPGPVREAGVAETIFRAAGINDARLRIEDRSRNTAENAANTLGLVEHGNAGAVLLVTSAWHMPRAMATFCTAGWENLVAWPVDFRSGGFLERASWNLAGHLDDLNTGAKEWVGLLAYRISGRISPGAGEGCGPQAADERFSRSALFD
ncbi:MAG: YdcF family protein [Paracoccaceae bacterium]|nr:YdcF family protein [Paracoccaceae bacterium]